MEQKKFYYISALAKIFYILRIFKMSFLNNFSFAFQKITLIKNIFSIWEYWEKVKVWEEETIFKWVILKEKNFSEFSFDENWHYKMTRKDWALRCNTNIEPKKWDRIESFWTFYEVIFTEKIIVEWEHDHNLAIIRIID